MKKWLQEQLKAKQEKRKALNQQKMELRDKIEKGKTIEEVQGYGKEVRSIETQMEEIDNEIADIRTQLDSIPDDPQPADPQPQPTPGQAQRSTPQGQLNVLGTYGVGAGQVPPQQQRAQVPEDRYGTLEYRQAFMKFAQTGEIAPELRDNQTTSTGDVSAVIPTTILNEVIRQVKTYGQVFNRVRKLNIKGGLTIPILSLKPTATWIGNTGSSDKQKVQANTNISFAYYGLECKVSVSLLADTTSLTGFENTITDLIVEAMVAALDAAVIKGDGTGKPLGITNDTRVPAAQKVTLSATDFGDWSAWKKKVFAKMPLSYKAGASFLMASGTFEGYIDGMTDANGQPIGRVNYGITEGTQERFGGKEVIEVEDDIIAPYDDATTGDVVAVYCNLSNYGFNSNMQLTMFRYFDHDTNEWVDKAILIADGKLIDPNGVVIVKKGA